MKRHTHEKERPAAAQAAGGAGDEARAAGDAAGGGQHKSNAGQDMQKPSTATAEANSAAADEIERLKCELEEAKDRALRAQAELDNYRKRVQREMDDALRYANINLMRDLLPVVDNLHRAAESAEKSAAAVGRPEQSASAAAAQSAEVAALLSGVKMVAAQFEEVLAKHHCKRIAAHGEPFDPNVHEAIAQQPSEEHPHGMVLLEATTGFQLHDRVVRPTQVIVSSGPGGA